MNYAISIVTGLLLGLIAYAIAVTQGSYNPGALPILGLALALSGAIMVFGTLERGGTLRLIIGAYMVLFFLFPGMLHVAMNRYPFFGLTYNSSAVLDSSVTVLVFCVFLFLGTIVRSAASSSASPANCTPIRFMRIWVIWLIAVLTALLIVRAGIGNFIQRRSDEITTDVGSAEVYLIIVGLARALSVISFAGIMHRFFYQLRTSWGEKITLGVMTLLAFVANYPLAVPRFGLFGVILILMPLYFNVSNPRFKTVFLISLLLGVGTIFPYISHLQRGEEGTSYTFDVLDYFRTAGDLDGMQSTINVQMLADQTGFRWGWQILSALLFFVPRGLWSEKGLSTGVEAAASAGYPYTNISSPLPSEIYLDFGLIGCVVFGFALGYFASAIDEYFLKSPGRKNLRHILVIGAISAYAVILMRGPLLSVIGPIALHFAAAYIFTSASMTQFLVRSRQRMPHILGKSKTAQGRRTSEDPISSSTNVPAIRWTADGP